MYRTVVIEDEERILNNICHRIERVSSRFQVVAGFSGSLQALQYLQNNRVDVILTDIRMPEMDGLTLLEQVSAYQNPLLVIVSSYQDFSYAQSAIRLNVCDYLLKPFLDEELKLLLERLSDRLDAYTTEVLSEELSQFLKSGVAAETLKRHCGNKDCFSLAIGCSGLKTTFWAKSQQGTALQKIEPVCDETRLVVPFFINDTNLMGCFAAGCGDDNEALRQARLWQSEKNTAVYTPCVQTLQQLPALYVQLCTNFTKAVFLGKPNLVSLAQLDVPERESPALTQSYQRLALMIQNAGRETVCEQLSVIVQQYEALALSQYELQQQLSLLLFQLYSSLKRQLPDYYGVSQILEDILGSCAVYSDITAGLVDALTQFSTDSDQNGKGSKEKLAQSIKSYLEENVSEPIGLPDIAEHFGFSHTYIIRIFREVFGASPIEHLIQLKINQAKELLRICPEKSVRAVAEQLGYSNQYYFSRAFKQVVGVSPAEYRRSL